MTIVTPNHLHAPIAHAFLDAGVHVIRDKPLTTTLGEAVAIADHARRAGRVFALTQSYTSLSHGAACSMPGARRAARADPRCVGRIRAGLAYASDEDRLAG